MANTLPNGVVVPAGGDRISSSGVQEMRTLGASVDALVGFVDIGSRARYAELSALIDGMEGMTYVGAWESGRVYRINDVVTHGGDSWARLTAGSAGGPGASPTDWGLVARKGDGGGFGELSETDVTGLYETVEPEPSVPVSWAELTGKPATYPPATHTHPVTDVDGLQAIIDRLTYDSGWRNITGLLTEGWSGSVFIQRTGAKVEVLVAGIRRGEGAGNNVFVLPTGFRRNGPSNGLLRPLLTTATDPPVIDRTLLGLSTFQVLSTNGGSSPLYGSFTFTTTDPIPATLPPLA